MIRSSLNGKKIVIDFSYELLALDGKTPGTPRIQVPYEQAYLSINPSPVRRRTICKIWEDAGKGNKPITELATGCVTLRFGDRDVKSAARKFALREALANLDVGRNSRKIIWKDYFKAINFKSGPSNILSNATNASYPSVKRSYN